MFRISTGFKSAHSLRRRGVLKHTRILSKMVSTPGTLLNTLFSEFRILCVPHVVCSSMPSSRKDFLDLGVNSMDGVTQRTASLYTNAAHWLFPGCGWRYTIRYDIEDRGLPPSYEEIPVRRGQWSTPRPVLRKIPELLTAVPGRVYKEINSPHSKTTHTQAVSCHLHAFLLIFSPILRCGVIAAICLVR